MTSLVYKRGERGCNLAMLCYVQTFCARKKEKEKVMYKPGEGGGDSLLET